MVVDTDKPAKVRVKFFSEDSLYSLNTDPYLADPNRYLETEINEWLEKNDGTIHVINIQYSCQHWENDESYYNTEYNACVVYEIVEDWENTIYTEGYNDAQIKIARNMLAAKVPIRSISEMTNISEDYIRNL